MTDTFIKVPDPDIKERSSFTATAYFRDSSDAADTPSTVHYRIDDLTTASEILGWTSVTPGASVSITIKSSENRIIGDSNHYEMRQLTVAADKDTDNETRDTVMWNVRNIQGFTG